MILFSPVIVKYMKKNLDITKPLYSEQVLSVPLPFVNPGSTVSGTVDSKIPLPSHLRRQDRKVMLL